MRYANSNESCIRSNGTLGGLTAEGVVVLSKVFEGPFNVPTTPCRRQRNDSNNNQLGYILSEFYNSMLQIVTIEQDDINIKVDILPRKSLRFWANHDTDYLFTFRCRGIQHSQL